MPSKDSSANLAIAAVFLVATFIVLSIGLPVFFNARCNVFFHVFAPICGFVLGFLFFMKKRANGRFFVLVYNGYNPIFGKGAKAVFLTIFALASFNITMGYITQYLLSYPTKLFAYREFVIDAKVTHLYRYAFSFRGYSMMNFQNLDGSYKAYFVWPADIAAKFTDGSCLRIHGASWFAGSYVDGVESIKCEK